MDFFLSPGKLLTKGLVHRTASKAAQAIYVSSEIHEAEQGMEGPSQQRRD